VDALLGATPDPQGLEWNIIQTLVGALLTVVGVYLSTVVRSLRKEAELLREELKSLAASNANLRERVVALETVTNGRRPTGRMGVAQKGG